MCFPRDEFIVGDQDVLLGHIDGTPVYISAPQYEAWKHTDLIIDVVPGRGGMFSLDNGRFGARSSGRGSTFRKRSTSPAPAK